MGHDRAHFQVRHLGDGDGVAPALGGGHFHAVAAHAAGIQAQVHNQRTTVFFGNQAGFDGEIKVTHQLFHIVRQRCFQLAECCRAYTDQLALETAFTYHTGFFVAGHTHTRYAGGNDRRHQQADAMTVGIGLEHGADFRFVADSGLQHANVVHERSFIDLDPGVAVLSVDLGNAVDHRQWRCGEGRVLQ